jgi:hypothetical protein
MARDVAIAIGVADARPLVYLSGALNGARAFHEWASKLGYESALVTDEDEERPVTIERLRSELERLLKRGEQPIHRMLVYFAGHGLIREAEEGLWLLSDWHEQLRAVAVEGLKRRLYMHDIQQIAIFSDSCRSLPPDIDAADLTPDPVLGRGPYRPESAPPIDKFIAGQDGSATFMVPGSNPEDDRCLFSGLLIEGLWGVHPEAFSAAFAGRITSNSLGTFLKSEVPKLAQRYQRKLIPNVSPTFPEGDNFYFSIGAAPPTPTFQPWPPAEAIADMGPRARPSAIRELERGGAEAEPAELAFTHMFTHITKLAITRPGPSVAERIQTQEQPNSSLGTGFSVEGGEVYAVWTQPGVVAERYQRDKWWRIGMGPNSPFAPVLVEFMDGMFAAITVVPNFIIALLREPRGVASLVYEPSYWQGEVSTVTKIAIARMEAEGLRADDAADLVLELRKLKHQALVLGVISAYLYDSIGDVDGIRQIAYYYASEGQPIPYDVALLAQVRGEPFNGLTRVRIPSVARREPRSEHEREHPWAYSATPETVGVVGGLWPWMRQGWTFLDDLTPVESTLVDARFLDLIPFVERGRFTTLNPEGGYMLKQIFNLLVQHPPEKPK